MDNMNPRTVSSPILLSSMLCASLSIGFPSPVGAQSISKGDSLPGYYAFYRKKGRLQRLGAEARRDEQIAAGQLAAQRKREALPPLALPLQTGEKFDFTSLKGKKNILVATYRAWW